MVGKLESLKDPNKFEVLGVMKRPDPRVKSKSLAIIDVTIVT